MVEHVQHTTQAEARMRLRTLSFGWLVVVASAGTLGAGCIESNRYIGDGQNVADSPGVAGSSPTGGAGTVGGSAIKSSSVALGGSSSVATVTAKSEVPGIAGAANIGGVTSNAGTASKGGAVGVGGTIGVAGAAGLGAAGGLAGTTTAPSPCGVFEGDWTVVPTVTSSAMEVDGSTPSNLPNVGQQLTPIGLHIAKMDNQCVVEMLPEWSRSTSVTLSGSNDQLTYTATTRQTEQFTNCGEVDWYVNQVTLSNLDSRNFQLRADLSLPESQVTHSAAVTIAGTLRSGLPTPELTGYRSIDGDRTWCQLDPIPPVLSPLLPWEDINVESSVPASDILDRLVSLESNEPVIVSWMTPVPSFEPGQVKTGKILDWDQVMGRTMRVQDPLIIARKVDYAFETVQLAKGFLANDLQNLTTLGTRSLAYVNGLPALRIVGAACSGTVYAAGRLDVSDPDSKGVVVALHNSQPIGDDAPSIKIFSRTSGTVIDAVLFELFSTPELSHYYASVGVEETEVGVQVSAKGSCAAGRGAPDISVISIVATNVSSWSSLPL